MTTRQITQWLLMAFIVIALIWDIIMATNSTTGDTISEVVVSFLGKFTVPIIAAIFYILGHLTWPQYVKIWLAVVQRIRLGVASTPPPG